MPPSTTACLILVFIEGFIALLLVARLYCKWRNRCKLIMAAHRSPSLVASFQQAIIIYLQLCSAPLQCTEKAF